MPIARSLFFKIGGYDSRPRGWKSEGLEFTRRVTCNLKAVALCAQLAQIGKHPGNESGNLPGTLLGEADVIEFFAERYLDFKHVLTFAKHAMQRRRAAFELLFLDRDWHSLAEIHRALCEHPPNIKAPIKCFIAAGLAAYFDLKGNRGRPQ